MTARRRLLARGFTLIELLVGLAVGLIVVLVITQVLAVAEGQKRSATTGADAQINGAVALYTVQRDLQMAGYGLSMRPAALGCELRGAVDSKLLPLPWILAPVQIRAGANGVPDSVRILGSEAATYSVPTGLTGDHPRAGLGFDVGTNLGVHPGDLMIAVNEPYGAAVWCSFFSVTDPRNAEGPYYCAPPAEPPPQTQVRHDTCQTTPWNPDPANNVFPVGGYRAGGYLLNLGAQSATNRVYKSYDVANNQLQFTAVAADGTETQQTIFPEIVQLKAFYGKDTNGDGTVDRYDAVTPTTNAGWQQVRSVRLAVVARSTQYEKDVVTNADPLWDVGTGVPMADTEPCGASQCITLRVLKGIEANRHYRYKVFDTVVPLRNLMWSS